MCCGSETRTGWILSGGAVTNDRHLLSLNLAQRSSCTISSKEATDMNLPCQELTTKLKVTRQQTAEMKLELLSAKAADEACPGLPLLVAGEVG